MTKRKKKVTVRCEWSEGFRFKSDPTKAHALMERIRKQKGGFFTPEDLVRASRAKTAATHEDFTWDNNEAADKYRIVEAKSLIRHLVIVREESNGSEEVEEIRAYRSVVPDKEQPKKRGYTSIDVVVEDEDFLGQLLAEFKGKLAHYTKELQQHRSLSKVHGAAKRLIAMIEKAERDRQAA